jgi:hypothetical protein
MSLSDGFLLDPYPFEIWIAVRTNGIKWTGTLNDPYDGRGRERGSARRVGLDNFGAARVRFAPTPIVLHLFCSPCTYSVQWGCILPVVHVFCSDHRILAVQRTVSLRSAPFITKQRAPAWASSYSRELTASHCPHAPYFATMHLFC